MEWSAQQDAALMAVRSWLATRSKAQQVFKLWGYAGTGKTTLARHLATGVDGLVLYASFTGKAASVMRQAGCQGATTLHSLIYLPKDRSRARLTELEAERVRLSALLATPDAAPDLNHCIEEIIAQIQMEMTNLRRPSFILNPDSILAEASLLVIDECSMIGRNLALDVLGFGRPVLVLGDPAQLPPVMDAGFFTAGDPDIVLTEIHRQARDNPIIDLATRIRDGEGVPYGQYGESRVLRRGDFDPDSVEPGEQVIVGTNRTRARANARIRRRRFDAGIGPIPVAGDRLVCLRNNHELGLMNGSIWEVRGIWLDDGGRPVAAVSLQPEDGGPVVDTRMHLARFLGEEVDYWDEREVDSFDFGYALTCHKAQGSQWPSVIVVDESGRFTRDRDRWLYTAVTRAQKKVAIVR